MWRFAKACAIGAAHEGAGRACEDRVKVEGIGRDVLICAVADGAGSAGRGGDGARLAVETATNRLAHFVTDGALPTLETVRESVLLARDQIRRAARCADLPARSFACTLLLVVLGREGGVAAQIGDGAIVLRERGDDGWGWAFWPQHGEFANQTRFVTDEDAHLELQCEALPPGIRDVALFSDGLERLALHHASRTVHGPLFDKLFAPLWRSSGEGEIRPLSAGLDAALRSPPIRERTHDDLSLVLATRRTVSVA